LPTTLKGAALKNLQEATERICELKGSLVALDALVSAVIAIFPAADQPRLAETFDANTEAARTVLLHADVSDLLLDAFERDVGRSRKLLQYGSGAATASMSEGAIDS
jgi:hypothetical protein